MSDSKTCCANRVPFTPTQLLALVVRDAVAVGHTDDVVMSIGWWQNDRFNARVRTTLGELKGYLEAAGDEIDRLRFFRSQTGYTLGVTSVEHVPGRLDPVLAQAGKLRCLLRDACVAAGLLTPPSSDVDYEEAREQLVVSIVALRADVARLRAALITIRDVTAEEESPSWETARDAIAETERG